MAQEETRLSLSDEHTDKKPRVILPYVILLGIPLIIIMINFDAISQGLQDCMRDIYYTFNPEAKRQAEEKWEKWRTKNYLNVLLVSHDSYIGEYDKYDLEKMDPERRKETEKLMKCAAEVWDERGVMTYLETTHIDKAAYRKRLGELHISDAIKNYLLNGSSSGLSIMDMSYDQLQDLRTGVSLLNEIADNNHAANECYGYYKDVGRERAGKVD